MVSLPSQQTKGVLMSLTEYESWEESPGGKLEMARVDKLWVELRHVQTGAPSEGVALRRQHDCKGWQWVRYQNRRYQVHGGGRVPAFIDLDFPLPKRGGA